MIKRFDKRAAVLALTLGFILTLAASLNGYAYSTAKQSAIAEQVMRFHVRANSDAEADQKLKALVKDSVLAQFRQDLESAADLDATRQFLTANLQPIADYAAEVVAAEGYDYAVTAAITTDYFPTRTYGDLQLPAGQYETLRIDIGAAEGQNWWCVMFPPLCYVDVSVKELPEYEKLRLKSLLTDEEYALVTGELKVKFKVVELWQKVRAEGELVFAKK